MSFDCQGYMGNHMVLQRESDLTLSGNCSADEEITVSIQERVIKARVTNGYWVACIPPLKKSFHETMKIEGKRKTVIWDDILVGDVYLLAGQSNMEFKFHQADTYEQDDPHANNPSMRYLEVPQYEYKEKGIYYPQIPNKGWQHCTPETATSFSAVGYYMSTYLKEHADVPIGLISVNRGGTSASCWINEETLKTNPMIYQTYYEDYWKDIRDQTDEQERKAKEAYDIEVKAYLKRLADYQKAHPQETMSQVKKTVGHTPWPGPKGKTDFCRPCGLYEMMLSHLIGLHMKAIIWYQGEEDTKNGPLYHDLLSLLIHNWRSTFMEEIPFIIVQLPEYNDDKNSYWSVVREAQEKITREIENTSLVVTMNCGEEFNIHPLNKKEVGRRVGMKVRQLFYDSDFNGSAPQLISIEHHPLRLVYDQILKTDQGQLMSDQNIKMKIENNNIIFDSDVYPISYAYKNYAKVHICGENDLPISPFHIEQ